MLQCIYDGVATVLECPWCSFFHLDSRVGKKFGPGAMAPAGISRATYSSGEHASVSASGRICSNFGLLSSLPRWRLRLGLMTSLQLFPEQLDESSNPSVWVRGLRAFKLGRGVILRRFAML